MSITQARKGDRITWYGRSWLLTNDPVHSAESERMGVPIYWVAWVGWRPAYSGGADLRGRLIGGISLAHWAPVQILSRDHPMTLPWDARAA